MRPRTQTPVLVGSAGRPAHDGLGVLAADQVHHLDLASEGFDLLGRHVSQDRLLAG